MIIIFNTLSIIPSLCEIARGAFKFGGARKMEGGNAAKTSTSHGCKPVGMSNVVARFVEDAKYA